MVPLKLVPFAKFQRRERAHFIFVFSDWNFLFLISDESDSGATVFHYSGWRCRAAADPADVSSFAMVRRTGAAFRGENAAGYRADGRRDRFCVFRGARHESELLESIFSCVRRTRLRNGGKRWLRLLPW